MITPTGLRYDLLTVLIKRDVLENDFGNLVVLELNSLCTDLEVDRALHTPFWSRGGSCCRQDLVITSRSTGGGQTSLTTREHTLCVDGATGGFNNLLESVNIRGLTTEVSLVRVTIVRRNIPEKAVTVVIIGVITTVPNGLLTEET